MGVTIVEPSFELYKPKPSQEVYKSIMDADDICQGREPDNEQRYAWAMEKLMKELVQRGDESCLEHESASAVIVCDQWVARDLLAHRRASFSVESLKDDVRAGGVKVVCPKKGWTGNSLWRKAASEAGDFYEWMLKMGSKPETACSALPMSFAVTMRMTASMRAWRDIMRQRTSNEAKPQMRRLMAKGLRELMQNYSALFDDFRAVQWEESDD